MISVLAFNFGDMSSNPAEAYIFLQNLCLKRTKINKKRSGFAKLKKMVARDRFNLPVRWSNGA